MARLRHLDIGSGRIYSPDLKPMNTRRLSGLAGFLILYAIAFPQIAAARSKSDKFTIHGQIRTGYYFIETRTNAGAVRKTPEGRLRARIGLTYRMSERLSFTARAAGRYSTDQEKFEFWPHLYGSSPGGLRLGQTAFDMFHVQWTDGGRWMIQAGRMQHAFRLRGVIDKGLDRYHSSNVAINWADGLWVRHLVHRDWYVHGIVQYNHPRGSTSVYTPPLDFSATGSRFSFFAALEGKDTSGLWNQREISITLIPSSLRNTEGALMPYWVVTGRLGVNLPLNISFMKIMIAGEAGYAWNAPLAAQLNLPPSGTGGDGAAAWQASLNFMNILGRQNVGFLYGSTDPGWLIAPSFRNNTNTVEVRHQYRFNRSLSSEVRYRVRNQLYAPQGASMKRRDADLYARITYRF